MGIRIYSNLTCHWTKFINSCDFTMVAFKNPLNLLTGYKTNRLPTLQF